VIRVREDPGLPPGRVWQEGIFAQLGDKAQSQVRVCAQKKNSSCLTSRLTYADVCSRMLTCADVC
jgi:hypothetical protein